jgi:hypothetical protein
MDRSMVGASLVVDKKLRAQHGEERTAPAAAARAGLQERIGRLDQTGLWAHSGVQRLFLGREAAARLV